MSIARKCTVTLLLLSTVVLFTALPVFAAIGRIGAPSSEFAGFAEKGYADFLKRSSAKGALPSSYDMRDYGFVTSVKNQIKDQEETKTCWAFSSLASLESTYLKSGKASLDLSEMHLAWYTFAGEPGFDGDFHTSFGNNMRVAAMLSRWTGAVLEEDCPFGATPAGESSDYKNRLLLNGAYEIVMDYNDEQSSIELLKRVVQEYGGVSAYLCYAIVTGGSEANYNPETGAYFTAGEYESNHLVLVCGWDDNYSRENFLEINRPVNDGAWLVKNSFGTEHGNEGYNWISYETRSLRGGAVFIPCEADEYNLNYGYDELGACDYYGLDNSDTIWAANVFTAKGYEEKLKSVGIYAASPSAEYEIYVYTGLTDSANPTSGTMVHGPQEGTMELSGYYVVELDKSIALAKGETFSIVVKMTTSGFDTPLAVETKVDNYSSKAEIQQGVSFASGDGEEWFDLSEGGVNACIKALTLQSEEEGSSSSSGCSSTGAAVVVLMASLCTAVAARRSRS